MSMTSMCCVHKLSSDIMLVFIHSYMNGCTCLAASVPDALFQRNAAGTRLQSNTVAVNRAIIVTTEPLSVIHSDLCPFSADIISTVEFNYSGELLATGDKGGRVVIFQHEQEVRLILNGRAVSSFIHSFIVLCQMLYRLTLCCSGNVTHVCNICFQSKNRPHLRGEYNVYSTFQSHEPEFDYLKSLEIEEKINKIRWLPQQNAAHFLLSTNGKSLQFIICRY